jgi:flagellar protein FlgJ
MAAIPSNVDGLTGLSVDSRSLETLKLRAGADPKGAIRAAAKQFESMFMQELMKSMRASTLPSGMLDNDGSKLGTEMLDGQFANQMSGLPGGLADVIARQLERQMGVPASGAVSPGAAAATALRAGVTDPAQVQQVQKAMGSAEGFVQQHQQAAHEAEAATGIPAGFLIAQAAHETGWGRHEIKNADGSPSYNLFGIKAGKDWTGPTAEITTTEYVNGRAQKVKAKFRAYASYAESFADYAKLMKDNPRYQNVIAHASSAKGFAYGLQRAGYATDPAYADKLSRVINTTLRLQRALA